MRIGPEPTPVTGTTVDLSEGGFRCVLARRPKPAGRPQARDRSADPPPPRAGDVVRVTALFPDAAITGAAEVTRVHDRDDDRLELSLRFIGLTENEQDLIRRHRTHIVVSVICMHPNRFAMTGGSWLPGHVVECDTYVQARQAKCQHISMRFHKASTDSRLAPTTKTAVLRLDTSCVSCCMPTSCPRALRTNAFNSASSL